MAKNKIKCCRPGSVLIDDSKRTKVQWERCGGVYILHTSLEDTVRELRRIGLVPPLNSIHSRASNKKGEEEDDPSTHSPKDEKEQDILTATSTAVASTLVTLKTEASETIGTRKSITSSTDVVWAERTMISHMDRKTYDSNTNAPTVVSDGSEKVLRKEYREQEIITSITTTQATVAKTQDENA